MKRLIAFALTFIFALALAGCNNIAANEPKMYTSSMQDDFPNAIPAEVNDNIIQNCTIFSENLGYENWRNEKSCFTWRGMVESCLLRRWYEGTN